jgi:hypothetical protein
MDTKRIQRDRSYTLFELADRAGLRVAQVQDLVHRGKLVSHYTDDTEVINGKDFLQWAEQNELADEARYE